jgi:hypothetical protein
MMTLTPRKPADRTAKTLRVLTDHPGYAAEAARLHELTVELAAIELRKREILAAPAEPAADFTAEARALLDDARTADAPSSEREYAKVAHGEIVQREAIRIQKSRVQDARAVASAAIVEQVRPEYETVLRQMAEALVALGQLADQEAAIRDKLIAADVSFSGTMPAMPLNSVRLGVYASKANLWLNEVERLYGIRVRAERRLSP